MCPINNGSVIDACLLINYYAYSVVNNNQIALPILIEANAACGDACSSISTSCSPSCTTCNGQQVAGADTPVSRRYDMGASSGTFKFDYNTFTIKDRIMVGMMQIYFLILAVSVQVVQSILATRALHRAYALMLNQTVTAPTATGVLEPLGGSPLTV
ncbi:unnamed protein product [Didymodactylos carnosus]|uniref:Transmembrane protein n=1 Tax=Didymodactylos carnosus TaxID=1234261 RepID=A0A816EKS8_9BILA|nr:unnamed protein product [Didymodactylos carnosus]CAF4568967.1 unnamed protein product [Didymodactylos carnosus]